MADQDEVLDIEADETHLDDVEVVEVDGADADLVVDEADADVTADADDAESSDEAESSEEAAEVIDPVAEFKATLRAKPGEWFVVHSYAGYENRVKANLETRIISLNMEDYIFEIDVPMEEVTEIKNGQKKLVRRVRMPGYVLVRMDLTDASWGAVRHTPGVTGFIKLQINAGAATPAPPVGPALGQHGVNIMEFVKAYNAATEHQRGNVIPVEITVYEDRSFTFVTKTPPAAELIKKAAGIAKGSSEPHKTKVAKLTADQVREIAQQKLEDLNANDVEMAARIIAGTARSMGVQTEGY